MAYLEHKGLIDVLRAGMPGGNWHPCAWLRRNELEDVVQSFSPEVGTMGGWAVPVKADYGNRVFRPKCDQVLSFLKSFGLSTEAAEHVLKTIGMAS